MDKELYKKYQKQWRKDNPDYQKAWRKKHPGYITLYMALWRKAHPDYYPNRWERDKRDSEMLVTVVLTHYGGGKLACVKCGFNDRRALSLDHIDGGGARQRYEDKQQKKRTTGGRVLYARLLRKGFPKGFQTLCMNCQWIKKCENNEVKKYIPPYLATHLPGLTEWNTSIASSTVNGT